VRKENLGVFKLEIQRMAEKEKTNPTKKPRKHYSIKYPHTHLQPIQSVVIFSGRERGEETVF